MHNDSQAVGKVSLDTFGGLVSLAGPESIPEGASPRTYDTDFDIGSVFTRPGQTNVFTYSSGIAGPSPGGAAVDEAGSGGSAWVNPARVLLDDGMYASTIVSLSKSLVATSVYVTQTTPHTWVSLNSMIGPGPTYAETNVSPLFISATAQVRIVASIPTNAVVLGVSVAFTAHGGNPGNQPIMQLDFGAVGSSVTVTPTPTPYTVGSPTSLWGVPFTPALLAAGITLNIAPVFNSGPNTLFIYGVSVTVYYGLPSHALDITQFGFAIPVSQTPQGFLVAVTSYANAGSHISVQMLRGGVPVGNPEMIAPHIGTPTTIMVGGNNDLFGETWLASQLNATNFGVRITAAASASQATVFVGYVTLTAYTAPSQVNFNWIEPFEYQNGNLVNLALDAGGTLFAEDATNAPNSLVAFRSGIAENSFANGINGPDVEYIAFNDLSAGSDIPLQYKKDWIDKITQVGPGAGPQFAASQATANTYAIANIKQPAAVVWGFAFGLQSTGPGTTTAGNVVTQYYADSTLTGPDAALVAAFNSGQPVYLYLTLTAAAGSFVTPDTVIVTSVGLGTPPNQSRPFYYFTYQVPSSVYAFSRGQAGYGVTYQQTLATLATSVPVPALTVGSNAVVTGNSVAAWNSTWPITQTLNSGSMSITQSSLTAGVATYSYAVVAGANPVAGQMVTITGTLNANGSLNVANTAILAVTGTNIGTFTITGFQGAVNYQSESETGQATTAGTLFTFEPGIATLGTGTSPIHGTGTGGNLTVTASGQYVGSGTRQGCVGFITRNGYYTAPSPPVIFTTPDNTTAILASNVPIGPPNVIGRYFIFTEAGQNGVPGANFFLIPIPVTYIVSNVSYTADATIINDNVSTTASFFFTDSVLLNAQAADVQGNDLFNLIEIGNPGWIKSYAYRNFYGLCLNKVQNFLNLSFDGGYLLGQPYPLGWSTPDIYGKLLNSPVFGNSYYVRNPLSSTLALAGLISQPAYQDAYQVPIINANVSYDVRVTARVPASIQVGSIVIALVDQGIVYGSFTLPLAQLSSAMTTVVGNLLVNPFTIVPATLQLQVYGSHLDPGADFEIDRIEPFNANIPVLQTTIYASYVQNPESVDGVTGQIIFNSENQQAANGATVLYDTLYLHKGSSLYSTQDSPNLEPSNWTVNEVSQRSGACGINAYDFGEQWFVSATRNGVYLFVGGQPGKIMQEIYSIWDAINWNAGNCIWVKNDVIRRRLYIGVPMVTPNFWLPKAAANTAPTLPNVILMLNYQGLDTGEEIKGAPQMHTTMFGTLNAVDMRRKWTIWQIPAPYGNFLDHGGESYLPDQEFYLCNGTANSKIYLLDKGSITDDGVSINSLYTTYGFVDSTKAQQNPLLGFFRKLWSYLTMTVSGSGKLNVTLYPNVLLGPDQSSPVYKPWSVPGGFKLTDPSTEDREATLNFQAQRTFVEFATSGYMNISRLIMLGRKNIWNSLRGIK